MWELGEGETRGADGEIELMPVGRTGRVRGKMCRRGRQINNK